MNPFDREILELIAFHDGAFSWYQIDRELASFSDHIENYLPLLGGLIQVLQGLKESGLITERAGHIPSQPIYSITARGRQLLRADAFAPLNSGLQKDSTSQRSSKFPRS